MKSQVEMSFSQQELNDIYYCVETISRKDFNFGMNERLNLLGDKIGDMIYKLAKMQEAFEEQLAQDKLNHDLNFKRNFIKHGDY